MKSATRQRLLLLLAAATIAAAAWTRPVAAQRHYNPATETTLQGTVSKVYTVTGKRGWNGVHLAVQSQGETYDVHLGPSAWIDSQGFAIAAGDSVEVVGSKVKFEGSDALIARQITKEGKVLVLRDSSGFPKWSGSRWRTP